MTTPTPPLAGAPDLQSLKALALELRGLTWLPPTEEYGDAGGRYREIRTSEGDVVIGECGPDHAEAAFIAAANPATILALIARLAAASQSVSVPEQARAGFIKRIVQGVAEMPDRDSPEDQPEMMLVTGEELRDIVAEAFEHADENESLAAPAAPLPQPQADAHPLDGVHINQGSMDAAADQYERDYAAGARLPGRATIRKALADAAAQQGEGSIDSEEFRKLSFAYAQAILHGSVPESSAAWAALVNYVDACGTERFRNGWFDGANDAAEQLCVDGSTPSESEWAECERIADVPDVDEAIRGLIEDATGDNAVCMVRAVLRARLARTAAPSEHPDDLAVDRFATAMKARMAQKRAEGRSGWERPDECSIESLKGALGRTPYGRPVDIGNYAMMLWNRAQPAVAAPTDKQAMSYEDMMALVNASPAIASGLPLAPAPLEAHPIPTDLSKRLRAIVQGAPPFVKVALPRELLVEAADEIDRYHGGMVAWKTTAEEKDAEFAESGVGSFLKSPEGKAALAAHQAELTKKGGA